jgi:hypothetical protein
VLFQYLLCTLPQQYRFSLKDPRFHETVAGSGVQSHLEAHVRPAQTEEGRGDVPP